MTFLRFCKRLLLSPVTFTNTYFKGGLMKPAYTKYQSRVLYLLPIGLLGSFWSLGAIFLFFSTHSLAVSLFMLFFMVVYLSFYFLFLWISYALGNWIFYRAVRASDGSLSSEESRNLYFYIASFNNILGVFSSFLSLFIFIPILIAVGNLVSKMEIGIDLSSINLLRMVEPIKSFTYTISFFTWVLSMIIKYRVINKMVDANGAMVILFEFLITILVSFSLVFMMILLMIPFFAWLGS